MPESDPDIDFRTEPARYRHWQIKARGAFADLVLDVAESAGLRDGYSLKLNSYDLGVDIELHDAVQRLRFEHPEVKAVVLRSGKERVFSAGANIRMLAQSSHAHKVNFCKFTNETRLAIEEATVESGQKYLAAINGTCAGGGYELALAAQHLILMDDGSSSVSLPEVPLLGVLPGTGGLTRLTDKRRVRRDRADAFCTTEEGVRGERAVAWRLVDEVAPASRFDATVQARAEALADTSDRPTEGQGCPLLPLRRQDYEGGITYTDLRVTIDRDRGVARLVVRGPEDDAPDSAEAFAVEGANTWLLRLARELDDAVLHLRFNEPTIGTLAFESEGSLNRVLSHDRFLAAHRDHWLVREVRLLWKRTLKRIDLSSKSLLALVRPGSCFGGLLAELVFACDRAFMAEGSFERHDIEAQLALSGSNFGTFPMSNGLSRIETRFWGDPDLLDRARESVGQVLLAPEAERGGLVSEAMDDIDWDDEVRLFLEERGSFSPDALTGMEANLRFGGPETMETKIFGRLSAWQNWVFQRPNAVGVEGALKKYGTGQRPLFDRGRV